MACIEDTSNPITHAVLSGERPQSVDDAAKLLSFAVANTLQRKNYPVEAEYVRVIAGWNETTDGRYFSEVHY